MKKKSIVLITCIIGLTFISVLIYGTGKPGYGIDFSYCHWTPPDISIEIVASEEISANTSSHVIFTVIATGANLFIQSIPDIFDNDLFVILPTIDKISDNSIYDLNSSLNAITVDFNVTTPATVGNYTIFIIAAEEPFGQLDFAYASIYINVGGFSEPPLSTEITPIVLFLDNYNFYLGGFTLLFMFIGTIIFQINMSRKRESKTHGFFLIIALVLTTVNVFLILNDIIDFTFKPIEVTNNQIIDQLVHIILGSVGYITGIIVVFGTFTNVPGSKMKLFTYVMLFTWTFNFLFEIFMPTGG